MKRLPLPVVLLAAAMSVTLAAGGQIHPQLLGIGSAPGAGSADAFFDDSVLQEIRLVVNTRDWQSLKDHFFDNTYYPSDMQWRGLVVRNVGIRSRGTGSRSGVKPGLRVDFNRYTTDQEFLGLKSFDLRNNTQDASNLHERVSMAFFRRMGLPAPSEAHTKLYVNNDYVGLYTIVEAVDKTFVQRTLGEDSGYLYQYDYPTDARPYYFEDRGSNPDTYVPLPFKPETHETDPRPEFIVDLVQAINQTPDAAFRTVIANYLDPDRLIRHVAIENFIADNDGFLGDVGMNNYYLYRFDNQTMFTFLPWDKSEAFKSGPAYSIFHNISGIPGFLQNRLFARLIASPDLYSDYLERLLECARSADEVETVGGPGWLEREMQREYAQIHDAALADPMKPFSNDDFERDVVNIELFARQRGTSVTQQVTGAVAGSSRWRGR